MLGFRIGNVAYCTDVSRIPPESLSLLEGLDVPVSYTHLRAHETVLDLVCRLLLEKKKQKNINILYEEDWTVNAQHQDTQSQTSTN